MKLEEIGFYTLCDSRAQNISPTSPMWRCEMILTDRCNFKCKYCRGLRSDCVGDIPTEKAIEITNIWADDGLQHVRYSGGEPTIHHGLLFIVANATSRGVKRIAISTNGSAPTDYYERLIEAGVNDFSISLDACCASFADKMAGTKCEFNQVVKNITHLSKLVYVSCGVVLTEDNVGTLKDIVMFAHDLGVADIRIISAAQYNEMLAGVRDIGDDILDAHPILKYRVNNIRSGRNVRGLKETDCHTCHLMNDDCVVAGDFHFPCVIYMREQGAPIGRVGRQMRQERIEWLRTHNTFEDSICKKNCLDVCIDFNNRCEEYGASTRNKL
jgi:MoaA/NifB/PqqE/SkfB family radical SAM enzyme